MTNKIVDEINVKECAYLKDWYESRPNGFGGITIENYCYLYEDNCEKYPQCLYRNNQVQELKIKLKHKEQECEELKTQLKQVKYLYEVQDEKLIDELATENKKYKQALDEIESIAEQLYYQAIKDPVKREKAIRSIIDIIDKAREE